PGNPKEGRSASASPDAREAAYASMLSCRLAERKGPHPKPGAARRLPKSPTLSDRREARIAELAIQPRLVEALRILGHREAQAGLNERIALQELLGRLELQLHAHRREEQLLREGHLPFTLRLDVVALDGEGLDRGLAVGHLQGCLERAQIDLR